MRYFLALRPDNDGLEQLETLTRPLRQWELPARWQHTQDYHLTLCFLGHGDHDEVAAVRYSVDELAGSLTQPALRLAGLGAFGGKTHPKVLFAAVADPEQRCLDYHYNLCELLGVKPNIHFRPHITLCRPQRVPERHPRDWSDLITAFGDADRGPIAMPEIVLYQSLEHTNGGPKYHPVETWPLLPS